MAGCGASLGPEVRLGPGLGTPAQTCSRSPNPNQVRARRRWARPCRAAWNRSGAATGTAGVPPLTPPRWPPLTPPPRPPAWHWRAASPAGLQPQEGGGQEGGAGGDRRRGSGRGATRCGPRLQPEVVASIAVGNRRVSLGLVQFGNYSNFFRHTTHNTHKTQPPSTVPRGARPHGMGRPPQLRERKCLIYGRSTRNEISSDNRLLIHSSSLSVSVDNESHPHYTPVAPRWRSF